MFYLVVKNTFLYGNLHEAYMEQPSEYTAQEENIVCKFQ